MLKSSEAVVLSDLIHNEPKPSISKRSIDISMTYKMFLRKKVRIFLGGICLTSTRLASNFARYGKVTTVSFSLHLRIIPDTLGDSMRRWYCPNKAMFCLFRVDRL